MTLMQATMGTVPFASLTYTGTASTAASTSLTKTATINIGNASTDRWAIILFQFPVSSSGSQTISSATINGVTATIGYNKTNGLAAFGEGVLYALIPNTTGNVTVSVTLSGATSSNISRFSAFTLIGRTSLSYGSFTSAGPGINTSRSTSISCGVRGFILHQWIAGSAPTSGAWSGTDSTLQNPSSDGQQQVAVYDGTNGNGDTTVSTTYSQSNTLNCELISSSWTYV